MTFEQWMDRVVRGIRSDHDAETALYRWIERTVEDQDDDKLDAEFRKLLEATYKVSQPLLTSAAAQDQHRQAIEELERLSDALHRSMAMLMGTGGEIAPKSDVIALSTATLQMRLKQAKQETDQILAFLTQADQRGPTTISQGLLLLHCLAVARIRGKGAIALCKVCLEAHGIPRCQLDAEFGKGAVDSGKVRARLRKAKTDWFDKIT